MLNSFKSLDFIMSFSNLGIILNFLIIKLYVKKVKIIKVV